MYEVSEKYVFFKTYFTCSRVIWYDNGTMRVLYVFIDGVGYRTITIDFDEYDDE